MSWLKPTNINVIYLLSIQYTDIKHPHARSFTMCIHFLLNPLGIYDNLLQSSLVYKMSRFRPTRDAIWYLLFIIISHIRRFIEHLPACQYTIRLYVYINDNKIIGRYKFFFHCRTVVDADVRKTLRKSYFLHNFICKLKHRLKVRKRKIIKSFWFSLFSQEFYRIFILIMFISNISILQINIK